MLVGYKTDVCSRVVFRRWCPSRDNLSHGVITSLYVGEDDFECSTKTVLHRHEFIELCVSGEITKPLPLVPLADIQWVVVSYTTSGHVRLVCNQYQRWML